jgi:hypothetical protein
MYYVHTYVILYSVAVYAIWITVILLSLLKEKYVAYFNNTCFRKITNSQKKKLSRLGLEI